MTSPTLPAEDQHLFATWVTSNLLVICEAYLAIADQVQVVVGEGPDNASVPADLRQRSLELAGLCAMITRASDETLLRAAGALDPRHDPRPVLPFVRTIGESCVLLTASSSRGDLAGSYLAHPDIVERMYARPEVQGFIGAHPYGPAAA